MNWFMTRVVLHDGKGEDYEELHKYMAAAGFSKTIPSDKGNSELPDAMYDYRTDDEKIKTTDVRDKARAAADKTKKKNSIFTVRYDSWAAIGLTKATP